MSHTTILRRTGSALGATALLGVVLAAPAMAGQEAGPDTAGTQATTATGGSINGLDRFQREGVMADTTEDNGGVNGLHRLRREGVSGGMDRERQLGGFTYSTEVSTLPQGSSSQGATKPSTPTVVRIENDTIEYLQVGAGILAGAALVGVGVAVASRRNHRGLTPA
jgi:hypothetical protein